MNSPTLSISRRPALPIVIQPLHGGYDAARQAWNLAADQRPAGIAVATTVEQVREAVLFAREHRLRVVPQTTGHLAGAMGDISDALLVRTDLHDDVEVDPVARRARVKAGALWEDVVEAAAPHGLAAMHGSSPDVGVIGYSLGGGLSFYARAHALAANQVRAIELVTADGEVLRADAEHHADLFWALRGGGGNFGVVTAMEFDLLPVPEVFAGALFWPVSHAPEVLRAWVAWTRTAPNAVTTSLRVLRLPDVPDVPEPLRAVPVITVDGVYLGDADAGEALLAGLRAAAPAMIDTWSTIPSADILRLHGDPEDPTPVLGDHALLDELDDAAGEAFLARVGEDSGSPLMIAELRQLGGALAAPPADAGARGHLDGRFALFAAGVPVTPQVGEAIEAALVELVETMGPWANDRLYLNFAERGGSAEPAYTPEAYARLAEIRAEWDPGEVFVGSHRIAPAERTARAA
jgi:FAD/FMN-containing dehydrogenase